MDSFSAFYDIIFKYTKLLCEFFDTTLHVFRLDFHSHHGTGRAPDLAVAMRLSMFLVFCWKSENSRIILNSYEFANYLGI